MIRFRSAILIGILVLGVLISALFISELFRTSIPTRPTISEVQAIYTSESDLKDRVSGIERILIYPRDSPSQGGKEWSLPLFYVDSSGVLYRIDPRNNTITSTCSISEGGDCFTTDSKVHNLIRGKMVYFIDGSWNAKDGKSSPAYYYIDAKTGEIIFSYIGEDVYLNAIHTSG